jgi:hypothetical protein
MYGSAHFSRSNIVTGFLLGALGLFGLFYALHSSTDFIHPLVTTQDDVQANRMKNK